MLINVTYTLTALLALWSLLCLLRRRFPEQPGEQVRFRQPLGMAIFCAVLQGIMTLLTLGSAWGDNVGLMVFALVMQLICAVLVTEMCLHVLCITETGFTVRTFFGRVHDVPWAEIEHGVGGRGGIDCIVTAQGRFYVDFPPPMGELLLEALNQARTGTGTGLRMADGKKAYGQLPIRAASFDPFSGHVRDWGGMVFAYVLVLALGLGMLGLCGYKAFTPISEENTQRMEVAFARWGYMDEERINLYDADGMAYRVSYNVEGMEPVKAACGTDTTFVAHVRLARPDDGPDYYRIFALTSADGSETYMSFEHSNAGERKTWLIVGGAFAAFTAFWVFYVARSIQVGRYPERYSRKTIRRYFKDGYVR